MYPIITSNDFISCIKQNPNWHYKVEPVRRKNIIVALEYWNTRKQKTGRKFSSFRTYNSLYEFVLGSSKRFRHFYEVIKGEELSKMRYDVDMMAADTQAYNVQRKEILYMLIKAFTSVYRELTGSDTCEYIIYTSCAAPKVSYHIILPGVIGYHYQLDEFYSRTVAYLDAHFPISKQDIFVDKEVKYRNIIDMSIYKSLQNFRILYSCKAGKDRYKKILSSFVYKDINYIFNDRGDKENFFDSLSGYTNRESTLKLTFERKQIYMEDNQLDIDHAEVLNLVSNIGNFTIREINGGLVILTKVGSYICPTCTIDDGQSHVHDNENPYLHVSKDGEVWFDCRRNPNKRRTFLGIINIIDLDDIDIDDLEYEEEPKPMVTESKADKFQGTPATKSSVDKCANTKTVKFNYRDVINTVFRG